METVQVIPRARVRIDLNVRARSGRSRAKLSDVAGGPVRPGDLVTAYEPEDGVAAPATVVEIDQDRGLIFLDVDWASMRDDGPGIAWDWLANTAVPGGQIVRPARVVIGEVAHGPVIGFVDDDAHVPSR